MDQLAGTAIEDFIRRLGADTERMLQAIMRTAQGTPGRASSGRATSC
jgi:hypothetical protein